MRPLKQSLQTDCMGASKVDFLKITQNQRSNIWKEPSINTQTFIELRANSFHAGHDSSLKTVKYYSELNRGCLEYNYSTE